MKDSGYIISVGANRRICVFKDDTNALTLHPTFSWPESGAMSKKRWHNDDITSVVFCPPATLAAGNYDGQILLTNFDSGHVTHVLNAYSGQYMRSVDKSNSN
jgi:WD40 repeat protein